VVGADRVPARDSWVHITGTFHSVGADGVPELAVIGMRSIPTPQDPYEQGLMR
jgi:uncharacterized membrane protein YcgQ (UPF0703/DUF1980 family)